MRLNLLLISFWTTSVKFFLKAELFDDTLHAPYADGPATLRELLGNDFGGGLRVEEAVPDDLANDFGCATVLGFRSAFAALQCAATGFAERGAQLESSVAC